MDTGTMVVVILLALLFLGFPVWASLHSQREAGASDKPGAADPESIEDPQGA
jgi:hypothetical protein